MPPVISFVGRANSGKTTYLEKLIPELKRRGYRLAVVKHDGHGFEMDRPGKDTWRHAQAGADVVCISSPQKVALIRQVAREETLAEVVASLPPVDLILTEGYKKEARPGAKVEVYRAAAQTPPLGAPEELLALVADVDPYGGQAPWLPLDAPAQLADLLEQTLLR